MSARAYAVAADVVFDGTARHDHAAVVIEGAGIARIVGRGDTANLAVTVLPPGVWLAPGFVDLQVNGGGDLLFNDAPTPQTIRRIVAAHRRFGTTALLPTLISDSAAKMNAAVAAV